MMPKSFSLEKVANGGWIITDWGGVHDMRVIIAAFTSTGDLLAYLNNELPDVGAPVVSFAEHEADE